MRKFLVEVTAEWGKTRTSNMSEGILVLKGVFYGTSRAVACNKAHLNMYRIINPMLLAMGDSEPRNYKTHSKITELL